MNGIAVEKLTLSYPDGFHMMDAGEKERLNFLGGSTGECLNDPDRHIIISIGYKSAGGLGFLVNAKDAAKKTEAAIRKPMQAFSYHLIGFDKRISAGHFDVCRVLGGKARKDPLLSSLLRPEGTPRRKPCRLGRYHFIRRILINSIVLGEHSVHFVHC